MNELVHNLNYNKAVGANNVSNEMYCSSEKFINVLIHLIEVIINKAKTHILFNISIIKPLIKSDDKPNNDLNNLRPLAISDTIPNLVESALHLQIKKTARR